MISHFESASYLEAHSYKLPASKRNHLPLWIHDGENMCGVYEGTVRQRSCCGRKGDVRRKVKVKLEMTWRNEAQETRLKK